MASGLIKPTYSRKEASARAMTATVSERFLVHRGRRIRGRVEYSDKIRDYNQKSRSHHPFQPGSRSTTDDDGISFIPTCLSVDHLPDRHSLESPCNLSHVSTSGSRCHLRHLTKSGGALKSGPRPLDNSQPAFGSFFADTRRRHSLQVSCALRQSDDISACT